MSWVAGLSHFYTSPQELEADIYNADKFYQESAENIQKNLNKYYELYQKGLNGGKLENTEIRGNLILGKMEDIQEPTLVRNFGILSDKESGCIFSRKNWSFIKNDIVILSAIHAQKTVYLYIQNLNEKNLFFKNGRPSMFGREVSILYSAGFRILDIGHEIIMQSRDFKKAADFTLLKGCTKAARFDTLNKINAIFLDRMSIPEAG